VKKERLQKMIISKFILKLNQSK